MTKNLSSILIIFFFFAYQPLLSGQYSKIEEVTVFGSRINAPIVMETQKSGSRITFEAINKSYFSYDFTLSFGELQNLNPMFSEYHATVFFGRNRIAVLNVADESQPINYRYSINYKLSAANKVDTVFPYLIPIGEGKTVKLKEVQVEGGIIYYLNQFKLSLQDTVFAIRKGTVIALPDNKKEVERIFKSSSLEILHDDRSISIFLGLNPEVTFLRLGQIVYPGQPVGIIGSTEVLSLHVVAPKEDGRIETLPINFTSQDGTVLPSNRINGTKVIYPQSIVKKELSAKEIKKLEKNALY